MPYRTAWTISGFHGMQSAGRFCALHFSLPLPGATRGQTKESRSRTTTGARGSTRTGNQSAGSAVCEAHACKALRQDRPSTGRSRSHP